MIRSAIYKIFNIQVHMLEAALPELNKKVCGASSAPCDALCGGPGGKCGGICGGTVWVDDLKSL